MFIRCSQEELSYALSVVARALPIRGEDAGNIPDGVLLTADSRGLTLTVINEDGDHYPHRCSGKGEGVAVIGRIFNEVVRLFPREVTLERDTRMYISAPGSHYALLPGGDTYPLLRLNGRSRQFSNSVFPGYGAADGLRGLHGFIPSDTDGRLSPCERSKIDHGISGRFPAGTAGDGIGRCV